MGQAAHLASYASLGECEVVALAEIRSDLRDRVASRWGVPAAYPTHREMMAQESLDGIVAAQPFSIHDQLVPELLEAGVPVLIEKPLAHSVEAGEQLAALAAGKALYLGYHKRSDPSIAWMKERLSRESLTYVRLTMPPGDWIAGGFRWNLWSSASPPDSGQSGGPFVDFVNYYIHQVNLLRYILGEDYGVSYADPGGKILAARSDSGVAAVIEMVPYTTSLGWEEEVLACFDGGWVRASLPAPLVVNQPGQVHLRTDEGHLSPILPPESAMARQAQNFLRAIRGEAHPLADAETGLKDLVTAAQFLARKGGAR